MVARRQWTREWFDTSILSDEIVTSAAVLEELERGVFPGRAEAISMIKEITPLQITDDIRQIVREYIDRKLMPADPSGDALHLAVASFYGCDYLATWNCKHLANAKKFGAITRINDILGLAVPALVTPLELLETGDDDG